MKEEQFEIGNMSDSDFDDTGFDFDNTIETNRLVYKRQTFDKLFSYFFLVVIITIGLGATFEISKSLIHENPSFMDYFMAVFILIIVLLLIVYFCKLVLTRDKLVEIETNSDFREVKSYLKAAAKNLKWKMYVDHKNYMIYIANFQSGNENTITIIFHPITKKVLFNSMNFPYDYVKPARFNDNYSALVDEYLKIEKENKRASNKVYIP